MIKKELAKIRELGRGDVEPGCKPVGGNVGRSGKKVTLPLYMAMFI